MAQGIPMKLLTMVKNTVRMLLIHSEYRKYKRKHLQRQIKGLPNYLHYIKPKIFNLIRKLQVATSGIFGSVRRGVINGVMGLLAALIILYLIALAALALGKLAEPMAPMFFMIVQTLGKLFCAITSIPYINNNIINNITSKANLIWPLLQNFWLGIKNTELISMVTILATLLAGLLFSSIFKEEEGILVLPFNVELSDAKTEYKLSAKSIQDQFIANLNKILWIHREKLKKIDAEMIHAQNETLPKIDPKSESLTYNMAELGTITAGPIGLSIGQILMVLRQLSPFAYPGNIIKGSLHQFGSDICLVATLGPKSGPKGNSSWVIRRSFKDKKIEHEKIFELISDLSYQIAYEFVTDDIHNNWLTFKYFTEARLAYYRYSLAKDDQNLKDARKWALKAANSSHYYEKVFSLIYNLGIAYINKKWYEDAEKLFRMLVILEKDNSEEYRWWGLSLLRLRKDELALKCYEKALEILKIKSEMHLSHKALTNKGISHRREKDYTNAINSFKMALEVDPDYGFAWGNLGNTLEAQSSDLKSESLYMLISSLKADRKLKNQVDDIENGWSKRRLTEDITIEKLIDIIASDLAGCCKGRKNLSDKLKQLSTSMKKTRKIGEAETKSRDITDKTTQLAKFLNDLTEQADEEEKQADKKEFEGKCKTLEKNCRDLLEFLENSKEIQLDIGNGIKDKCCSIRDQCNMLLDIFSKSRGKSREVQVKILAKKFEKFIKNQDAIALAENSSKEKSVRDMYNALTEVYHILGLSLGEHAAFEEKVLNALGRILEYSGISSGTDIAETAEKSERYKIEAIKAYLISAELNPEYTVVRSSLARLYKKDGKLKKMKDECEAAWIQIKKQNEYNRACHYAICGDYAEAFESLRRALVKKQTTIKWLEADPDLEDLRKDPKFEELRKDFTGEEEKETIRARISQVARYRKFRMYERKKEECDKLRKEVQTENIYTQAIFEAVCGNDLENAFTLLETALCEKYATADEVMGDPDFEFLRDEPNFQSLIEKYSE